jgi:putative transposase
MNKSISFKTCPDCKHVMEDLSLDVREWVYPECGAFHDKDINAARNILVEGHSVSAVEEVSDPNARKLVGLLPAR